MALPPLLIADALLVLGMRVEDIISEKQARPHRLTAWTQVKGTELTYPAASEMEVGPHP